MRAQYLLAEQTIGRGDLEEVVAWLQTNPWLTKGPLTEEFERQWSAWLGTQHALFVNSGSSANLLMYYAALLSGKLKNTKIVVPAVSWATTVAPAIQLGFHPIMCDAHSDTFGLDPDYLENLLHKHDPGAVVIAHVLGVPNDMDALLELQERFGFMLLEDACAALGSRYRDRAVGTFGDMSTFSFYYGHHLSTIEGGMVCTDDGELFDILVQIRSHGWPKDLTREREEQQARDRAITQFHRAFTFYYPGFNVRSTDLNARIGLSQLAHVDAVVQRRIENHGVYQSRFATASCFDFQRTDRSTICSISFAALAQSADHRSKVADVLTESGIETRPVGGGNMSRQPFWADRFGVTEFAVADRIQQTGFQLPNHHLFDSDDIDHICDVVLAVDDDH